MNQYLTGADVYIAIRFDGDTDAIAFTGLAQAKLFQKQKPEYQEILVSGTYASADEAMAIWEEADEGDGLLSIEMKHHVLHLDDMVSAVIGYASDIDYGRGDGLQSDLEGQAGCSYIALNRNDWITVSSCLRCANDHSAAAYIESFLDDGTDAPGDQMG